MSQAARAALLRLRSRYVRAYGRVTGWSEKAGDDQGQGCSSLAGPLALMDRMARWESNIRRKEYQNDMPYYLCVSGTPRSCTSSTTPLEPTRFKEQEESEERHLFFGAYSREFVDVLCWRNKAQIGGKLNFVF